MSLSKIDAQILNFAACPGTCPFTTHQFEIDGIDPEAIAHRCEVLAGLGLLKISKKASTLLDCDEPIIIVLSVTPKGIRAIQDFHHATRG